MPTATEAIKMLEGHEQCERRQQTKGGDYIAPSIVDGDDIFLGIIENGGICL